MMFPGKNADLLIALTQNGEFPRLAHAVMGMFAFPGTRDDRKSGFPQEQSQPDGQRKQTQNVSVLGCFSSFFLGGCS